MADFAMFPNLPEHQAFLNSLTPREMRDTIVRLATLAGAENIALAVEMLETARAEQAAKQATAVRA